jgi:hypothetical protein
MRAIRCEKWIGMRFILLSLLLATPLCAQAGIRCASGRQTDLVPNIQTTTANPAVQRHRFDVVPCADETPDRSNTDGKSDINSEAASFIAWIVEKTGWTAREAPPIRFVPYTELVNLFSGGKGTDYHVESVYSEVDHTIYLPDGWRPDDRHDRSVLLHELVHHLQYLNNVKATCASEYELQALKLQVAWLIEQGVDDPLGLLGISPLYLLMLGQCE